MAESSVERRMQPASQIWGSDINSLLQELTNVVTDGIRDAADHLLCSYSSFPNAPPPEAVRALLTALFDRIQPLLEKELASLSRTTKRNVFSVPRETNIDGLIQVIQTAKGLQDKEEESKLDMEIAAVRAEVRNCDMTLRHLTSVKDTTGQQVTLMQTLDESAVTSPEDVARQQLAEVSRRIAEAEEDYKSSVRIVSTHRMEKASEEQDPLLAAAASAVAKGQDRQGGGGAEGLLDGLDDEHGPLQHFLPSAQSILQVSMDGGADQFQELAMLRARLLG